MRCPNECCRPGSSSRNGVDKVDTIAGKRKRVLCDEDGQSCVRATNAKKDAVWTSVSEVSERVCAEEEEESVKQSLSLMSFPYTNTHYILSPVPVQ